MIWLGLHIKSGGSNKDKVCDDADESPSLYAWIYGLSQYTTDTFKSSRAPHNTHIAMGTHLHASYNESFDEGNSTVKTNNNNIYMVSFHSKINNTSLLPSFISNILCSILTKGCQTEFPFLQLWRDIKTVNLCSHMHKDKERNPYRT